MSQLIYKDPLRSTSQAQTVYTQTHTCSQDLDVCVFSLLWLTFAYLRWAVTVPHGGRNSTPTGPAALSPHGPGPPSSIHTLRPGAECNTLPMKAPLVKQKR